MALSRRPAARRRRLYRKTTIYLHVWGAARHFGCASVINFIFGRCVVVTTRRGRGALLGHEPPAPFNQPGLLASELAKAFYILGASPGSASASLLSRCAAMKPSGMGRPFAARLCSWMMFFFILMAFL